MVDLKKEQEVTLARPRMNYTPLARLLFASMDFLYGKPLSLRKIQMLELLARIPYQSWEIRQYHRMTHFYRDEKAVRRARELTEWARAAQDNEFWHLRLVAARMEQLGMKRHWFWDVLAPQAAAWVYRLFCRVYAFVNIRGAFYLNAQFEDHAEHEYMQFVKDHPELDQEPANLPVAREHGNPQTWGDVFRQVGLDEREHMNNSLRFCGLPTVGESSVQEAGASAN